MERDNKKDGRAAELDRFWDIDALLPTRRVPARSRNTEAEEVTVAAKTPDATDAANPPLYHAEPLPPPAKDQENTVVHPHEAPLLGTSVRRAVFPAPPPAPAPILEYEPDSALLHRVSVYLPRSTHTYYDAFCRTAQALAKRRGSPAQPIPFFSYVPQYDQMTRAQLDWYLCLRDCIRKGVCPATDYSYLLLLAFEIINLAEHGDTTEGQATLVRLWQNYRAAYPQLSGYLPEWICDYSLIHCLPPPVLSHEDRTEIMRHCTLKEFYVAGGADGYLQALLCFASNYDYRKSKFCTSETRPQFDRVIPTVLSAVMDRLSRDGKLFSGLGMDDSKLSRFAYNGALCASENRRRLEVSYCSFSRSHELRFLVTDIVKYTENKLRATLGIRSRMTVYALPTEAREAIDAECAALLPKKEMRRPAKTEEPPAYEALYDLPALPLDPARAAEIERASWDTTERLVEAFEAEEKDVSATAESPVPAVAPQTEEKAAEQPPAVASPYARYAAFLAAVREADNAKIRAAAQALGSLPDALADEINELSTDETGDILLEDCGDGWRVLDDYRDRLDEILSETRKGD